MAVAIVRGRTTGWPLHLVVGLAGFVTTLDNTVVTVALPSIQQDLAARLPALEWVATGYIMTFAGLMLAGGRVADMHGNRRAMISGLALFTAASLAAGLATDIAALIAARLAQGVGAALTLPATLAVLAGQDERRRSQGVAVWMAAGAGALALGPVVGGYLSQHAHWSWVFLINVPIGLVTIGLALVAVPGRDGVRDGPDGGQGRGSGRDDGRGGGQGSGRGGGAAGARLDLRGLASSAVVLAAGTFALIHGPQYGWTSPVIVATAAAAAVAAVAFVAVERRAADPMVDPALFRNKVFTGGVLAQVLWGLGVNGVFFFTAIFLQGVLGFTPTAAGVAFVPLALLVVLVTPLAPVVERRLGPGHTVALGLVMVAAGMAMVAFLRPGDGWAQLLPAVCLIGAGSALTMPLGSAVLGAAPEGRGGIAGGVFTVSREISGLFGIALIGVIVHEAGTFSYGYALGLLAAALLVVVGALISLATLP
ncbi:MFS transporter [Nonomuraea soli]|uniref:MFS family permease n=1 Tax=Nonomuraea soli TaxID=1032476 RepID=A0A7W0CQG7_9ACTN|nr:MFS transporter [Nonomuraea soli]MBA2895323.1 MFS family permease [Nonomuraea soli]